MKIIVEAVFSLLPINVKRRFKNVSTKLVLRLFAVDETTKDRLQQFQRINFDTFFPNLQHGRREFHVFKHNRRLKTKVLVIVGYSNVCIWAV